MATVNCTVCCAHGDARSQRASWVFNYCPGNHVDFSFFFQDIIAIIVASLLLLYTCRKIGNLCNGHKPHFWDALHVSRRALWTTASNLVVIMGIFLTNLPIATSDHLGSSRLLNIFSLRPYRNFCHTCQDYSSGL